MREYHVIKMIRNANIRNLTNFAKSEIPTECHTFLLLDYFDFLFHIKLEEKDQDYETFLGMNEWLWGENGKPDISQRIIGLYTEDESKNGIFQSGVNPDSLSEQPLLGLIQVGMTPQYIKYFTKQQVSEKECLKVATNEIKDILNKEKLWFTIFHVLTSGDLYVAVRGSSLADIYKAAIAIGHMRQEKEGNLQNELWKFTTYTNVGIECSFENGIVKTFSSEYVETHRDDKFVLRFSAAPEIQGVLQDVLNKYEVRGLFGRYDYAVTISMEVFSELYPSLCIYKGPWNFPQSQEFVLEKAQAAAKTSFPELIKYGLDTHQIKILNERAIVMPPADLPGLKNETIVLSGYEKVSEKNQEIENRYHSLESMGFYFTKNRNSFKDSYRALGELIHAYGPLGYETDSKLNWNQYSYLMDVLFENLKYYEDLIELHLKEKIGAADVQGHFLESFRNSVEAINYFVKFIQSMNQQTFQAPVYEIQTRVDAEKLFMAYTEFMKEYLEGYYFYNWSQGDDTLNQEKRLKFCPIIYPNLSYKGISVISPFNTGREMDEFQKASEEAERTLLLLCRIPSFEYFGRFYEMIPLILHEMSHHILVLPRKERNDFIIYYMIKGVIHQLFHVWVMQHSSDKVLDNYGRLEEDLIDVFSQYYADVFKNNLERPWENCKIHYLEKKLCSFIKGLGSSYGEVEWEQTVKIPQNRRPVLVKYLLEFISRFEGDVDFEVNRVKEIAEGKGGVLYKVQELVFWIREKVTEAFHKKLESWITTMLSEQVLTPEQECARVQVEVSLRNFEILKEDLVQERLILEQKIEFLCNEVLQESNMLYKFLKDYIMPEIKSYCFDMLKLSDIVHLGYKSESDLLTVVEESSLEMKKAYLKRINATIESYKDTTNGKAYFCDLDVTQYVNELGVDFKDKLRVFTNWEKHAKQIDGRRLMEWADRNFTIYRETCADIIMSCAMRFTAFGFLNFAVNTLVNMYSSDVLEEWDSLNMERFKIVIAVLMPQDSLEKLDCGDYYVNCVQLKKQCFDYMLANIDWAGNNIQDIVREVSESCENKDTMSACCSLVEKKKNELKSEMNKALSECETKREAEFIRDYIVDAFKEMNEIVEAVLEGNDGEGRFRRRLSKNKQRIERQGLFWIIIYTIFIEDSYLVEGGMVEHLRKIYDMIRKPDGLCLWQEENHDAVKMIAKYYNEPRGCCLQTKKQMLDHSVQFIEHYYYKNRLNLAK